MYILNKHVKKPLFMWFVGRIENQKATGSNPVTYI